MTQATVHELVKWSKRGRELVLVRLPAHGRQLVDRIPRPVQLKLNTLTRRSLRIGLEVLVGLVIVGAVTVGLAYHRLLQGPISVTFLVPAIESAINRELSGVEVDIDDAVVQSSAEGMGVEFRLRNIRLVDPQGSVVAQAPLAAIGLSARALLWGRIAPSSVDFIGPRLLLFYSAEDGLSLTFSRPSAPPRFAGDPTGTLQRETGGASTATDVVAQRSAGRSLMDVIDDERQLSLTRTVAAAFERARGGNSASSYLTRFGVRDAMVVFDQAGQRSYWQVPDFAIDLQQGSKNSVLVGGASIASATGPWQLHFRTEQSREQERLTFTALVRDFVPTGLAANFPTLEALQAVALPLDAETSVELSNDGDLLAAEARLQMQPGQVTLPWDRKHPIALDAGDLRVRYVAGDDRIEVLPSTLRWGGSTLNISGAFDRVETSTGEKHWRFALQAHDSVLVAEEFGLPALPVDEWVAEGTVMPSRGRIVLNRFRIRAGAATVELAGTIDDAPGWPAVRLSGRIGAMPGPVFMQFWPKFIGAGAREWVGERVKGGQITGGVLEIDLAAGLLAQVKEGGDIPQSAITLDLDGRGFEISYIDQMPPIRTADAHLRLRGRSIELTVPEGSVTLPSGQRLALRNGRFSVDDLRPDPQEGRIAFTAAGPAAAALELLDHEPLGYARAVGVPASAIGGRVEGTFEISLPMKKTVTFEEVRLHGTATLDQVTSGNAFGRAELQGGTLHFRVTEQALHARGDVLLNGVPASVSGQRIFAAPADMQPELRIGLTLDAASRDKLGLNVNHLLRGAVPTIVTVKQHASDEARVQVQADLGAAELVLSNVGWRKPPGQAASLSFDVVESSGGETQLRNFKIVGDDISIIGAITLDANDSPKEFHFSDFSFNVITHLRISGRLRADNVWDVEADGPVYDGRQFFKSLFSAGELSQSLPPGPEEGGNIDLSARIGSMVGFFDTTARDVTITLKKRGGLLRSLDATANLNGTEPIAAKVVSAPGQPRVLVAETRDAGSAFRLIGFYPRVEGGEASLQVNLDGSGRVSKSGTLWARDFVILGDRVVGEVLSNASDDPIHAFRQPGSTRRLIERQRILFNQLRVPFSVGGGRFVLHDSYINGPLLGATLRGTVDFAAQEVELGGTYVPLYGLNSALGSIPLIGPLLVGRRGEGVLGITFAIQGPLSDPTVLVNPVSMVAPGIFRQIFEYQGGQTGMPEVMAQPVPRRAGN